MVSLQFSWWEEAADQADGREGDPRECQLNAPHKTGEQECRERPRVAELLVHHNTLNSKTLTHQLGEGEEGTRGVENGVREAN